MNVEGENVMANRQLFIDGAWTDASDGSTRSTVNPATGEAITEVAAGTVADVDRAVRAARRAFDEGPWGAAASPRDRSQILMEAAQLIRGDREMLAKLETHDSGKLYSDSLEDVDEAAFMFEYYAGWATKVSGSVPPVGPDAFSIVVKEPIGVAGLITPWNFPILMASQKIAPALATGCTAVLKPASATPLTALELGRILQEAGLPDGAFNVITGSGATLGDAIVGHPGVDKISFTGSTEVGIQIQKHGADTMKRVTLELGGKSPNLVFADAHLSTAYEMSAFGIFYNQGECCTAGSRVLVEKSIYDDAVAAMAEHAAAVELGDGMDEETTMGPMITAEHRTTVESYIAAGKDSSATLAFEGGLPQAPELKEGFFVAPTIFADVDNDDRIAREEIFGPVMSVIPFGDVDEAIAIANDTPYGLAAAVWTQDVTKAIQVSRAIRAGTVWVNDSQPAPTEAPFGGYKGSGLGRELGPAGIEGYLEEKHIYINLGG